MKYVIVLKIQDYTMLQIKLLKIPKVSLISTLHTVIDKNTTHINQTEFVRCNYQYILLLTIETDTTLTTTNTNTSTY